VRPSFSAERGSILFEFITFVLFGQLLVFGSAMLILGELDQKLRVDLIANQLARAAALGRLDSLLQDLKNDYQLKDVRVSEVPCRAELLCLEVVADSRRSLGVSLRNAQ
jgi:hypothetical protein